MSNYNSLKTTINANVKQNGVQAITGQILNSVLNAMVTTLGTGYQFAGVATTATNPGSPDAKVFYIANGKGTYTNFGGLQVTEDEVVVLYWDSSWHKVSTGIASQSEFINLKEKYVVGHDFFIEAYTTSAEVASLRYIRRNYNGQWQVVFNDADGNVKNQTIAYPSEESATGVLPLLNGGIIEGYIIVDWSKVPNGQSFGGAVKSTIFSLESNPYIKSYIDRKDLEKDIYDSIVGLETDINNNVLGLGGYWRYNPLIEQGAFSRYGIKYTNDGWWRMVLPINFKNATKFKVTPASSSVSYQFVYLLTNSYPTTSSEASRPLYDPITGVETEFELNDVVYVALCWRDNNNISATMEDALRMVSINVYSAISDANKVNSMWKKNSVVKGKNLFDVSKQVVGYLNADGNLIIDNNYRTSDLMSVEGLTNIVISNTAQNGLRYLQTAIIHAYDKNGKWKSRLSSSASTASITSSVFYIRISYRYYSSWDMAIQVESGSVPTEYERYYILNQLDDSVFEHNVNLEKDPSKLQIVCWGDSLTYGQGGTNYQYPSKLRDYLPNAEIKNFGILGEKSMAIACRQGAYPIIADPFNIPASGSVNITIKDVNGNSFTTLKHNGVRDKSVYNENIAGLNGTLGYSGGNYNFVRAFAGDAVSVDRPATFKMYGTHFREWLPIIWAGTNDAPTSANAEEIIKIIEGMVKYSNSDKYLVIGLTHQGTEPSFKNVFNSMLGAKFGIHFINLLEYLKNYGLADNGLTPTAQDTTDIANNLVPTSLRSDSVHFNDYGYIATAKCVYLKGKDLGYWE